MLCTQLMLHSILSLCSPETFSSSERLSERWREDIAIWPNLFVCMIQTYAARKEKKSPPETEMQGRGTTSKSYANQRTSSHVALERYD